MAVLSLAPETVPEVGKGHVPPPTGMDGVGSPGLRSCQGGFTAEHKEKPLHSQGAHFKGAPHGWHQLSVCGYFKETSKSLCIPPMKWDDLGLSSRPRVKSG